MNWDRITRAWRKAMAQLKSKLATFLPEPANALTLVPVRVPARK
jgi:hypothetical protein